MFKKVIPKISMFIERITPEFIKGFYKKLFIRNVNISYGRLGAYKGILTILMFVFFIGVKVTDNRGTINYLFDTYDLREVNNIYKGNYSPSVEEKQNLLNAEVKIVKEMSKEYTYASFVSYNKRKPGYIRALISSKVTNMETEVSKELINDQIYYRLREYLFCTKYNYMNMFVFSLLISFLAIDTFMFFYKYLVETERKSELNMMIREVGLLGKLNHMTFDMMLDEIMSRAYHYKPYLEKIDMANINIGTSIDSTYEEFNFQEDIEARYFFKILKLANSGNLYEAAEEIDRNDEIKEMERERFIKKHISIISVVQITSFFLSIYLILEYSLAPFLSSIFNFSI